MRGSTLAMLFAALLFVQAQAQQNNANSKEPITLANAAPKAESSAVIPAGAAVIRIKRPCDDPDGGLSSSSVCNSEITRSEFDSLVQYIQPNWSSAQRRQFASSYAEAVVLAAQAHKMGLDRGPQFEALMKMQEQFLLQHLVTRALEKKAAQVPDAEVEAYYRQNKADYAQIELQQLYIPIAQQVSASGLGPAELEKRRQSSVVVLKQAAYDLQARAVRGEDLTRLQTEAYRAAGYTLSKDQSKAETQTRRPRDLPDSQKSILDLPPGSISQVFDESNGHFVYKMIGKRTLPIEDVREEIVQKLRTQRLQQYQREAHNGSSVTLDETFFRAAEGTGNINNEP